MKVDPSKEPENPIDTKGAGKTELSSKSKPVHGSSGATTQAAKSHSGLLRVADSISSSNLGLNSLDGEELFKIFDLEPNQIKLLLIETMKRTRKEFEAVVSETRNVETFTYENTVEALYKIQRNFENVLAPIQVLVFFNGPGDISKAYESLKEEVNQVRSMFAQDSRVYKALKAYDENSPDLRATQRACLNKMLSPFEGAAITVQADRRSELTMLDGKLKAAESEFIDKFGRANIHIPLSQREINESPEDLKDYKTIDRINVYEFIKQHPNSEVRKRASVALRNMMSNEADLVQRIVMLRHAKARTLGFSSFAELKLRGNTITNPSEVITMLEDLALALKPKAQGYYEELLSFQKSKGYVNASGNEDLVSIHDKDFLVSELMKDRYDFDENLLARFLDPENCKRKMLDFFSDLYEINFVKDDSVPIWHDVAEAFRVVDRKSGKEMATLFLDLYSREGKPSPIFTFKPLSSHYKDSDGVEGKASGVIECSFSQDPLEFKFGDLSTMFHEFGHALHHLLSTVDEYPISGLAVANDFCEVPSVFNESFCSNVDILPRICRDKDTDEAIPQKYIEALMEKRKISKGLRYLDGVILCLADLHIHYRQGATNPDEVYKDLYNKFGVFKLPEGASDFSKQPHIFSSSNYASGNFVYLLGDIFGADLFSLFKETDISTETALRFRNTVLSQGASKSAYVLMADFLGRQPSHQAFFETF